VPCDFYEGFYEFHVERSARMEFFDGTPDALLGVAERLAGSTRTPLKLAGPVSHRTNRGVWDWSIRNWANAPSRDSAKAAQRLSWRLLECAAVCELRVPAKSPVAVRSRLGGKREVNRVRFRTRCRGGWVAFDRSARWVFTGRPIARLLLQRKRAVDPPTRRDEAPLSGPGPRLALGFLRAACLMRSCFSVCVLIAGVPRLLVVCSLGPPCAERVPMP
jgi:hypothetical protein